MKLIDKLKKGCVRVEDVSSTEPKFVVIPDLRPWADPGDMFGGAGDKTSFGAVIEELTAAGALEGVKVIEATETNWLARRFEATVGKQHMIMVPTAAKALGLKWSARAGGFLDANGNLITVSSDEEIFSRAGLPVPPPEERHLRPWWPRGESGTKLPMSVEEVLAYVKTSSWVDTWCGGEYHQYSTRNTGCKDETLFLRMAEMIRDYGYDGKYYGRLWRYLDYQGLRYFTNGCDHHITTLINRKVLGSNERERAWRSNPVKWKYFVVDDRTKALWAR